MKEKSIDYRYRKKKKIVNKNTPDINLPFDKKNVCGNNCITDK